MNYHRLSVVLSVLWSAKTQSHEIKLINQLNKHFGFDHNIFLIDAASDVDRFVDAMSATGYDVPLSLFRFFSNDTIQNYRLKGLRNIYSKSPLVIVVTESVCLICHRSFLERLVSIHRLQRNLKIGLFIPPQFAQQDELHKFFVWCWSGGIAHIFIATLGQSEGQRLETTLKGFTFDPFVDFHVVNVTERQSVDRFFQHQDVNYQRHSLRLPKDLYLTKEILKTFGKVMKNYKEVSDTPFNFFKGIFSQLYDLYDLEIGQSTYPFYMEDALILVPKSSPYPVFFAYFRSLAVDSSIGLFVGVVVLVVTVLTAIRFVSRKKIELLRSTVDVLNLLVNENSSIKYQSFVRAEGVLIVPLTFAGFLISNLILSTIISFFTRPHDQPEINSMEELYKSPLKFMDQTAIITYLRYFFPQYDWSNKVIDLGDRFTGLEIFVPYPSFAAILTGGFARRLIEVQKRMCIPGYRIPSEAPAFSKRLLAFKIDENFPFIERLNEIDHWMNCFGIHQKWIKEYMDVQAKIFEIIEEEYDFETKEIEPAVPVIIIHCWIISTFVFVLECLWKRFTLWRTAEKKIGNFVATAIAIVLRKK